MKVIMVNNKIWLIRYLANKTNHAIYYNPNKYSIFAASNKLDDQIFKRNTSTTSMSKGQAVSVPNLTGSVQLNKSNDEKPKLDLTFENSQLVCVCCEIT